MNLIQTMRTGFTGFCYPLPPGVDPEQKIDWVLGHAAELGCGCMHLTLLPDDPALLRRWRALAEQNDIEIELMAAGLFGLAGPKAEEARTSLKTSIAHARQLGCRILRTGYGRLTMATSRFNRDLPLEQHLERLAACLRLAAPLVEDSGLLLAIENHCDFTGREMASLFEMTGSPVIGAALDTANGYTVFCDPNDDVQALAPYAVTTHLKDMRVIDSGDPRLIPMMPEGCVLGQGNVDIPAAIRTLAEKSPWADGLHLVIEVGWLPDVPGKTPAEVTRETIDDSLAYLQSLVQEMTQAAA